MPVDPEPCFDTLPAPLRGRIEDECFDRFGAFYDDESVTYHAGVVSVLVFAAGGDMGRRTDFTLEGAEVV